MASVASDGTQFHDIAGAVAFRPTLDAEGSRVAFESRAGDLLVRPLKDTNFVADVYVHDRRTGVTRRVSEANDDRNVTAPSGASSLSADGRFVAFHSDANLTDDATPTRDVFLHDLDAGETNLLVDRRQEPVLSGDASIAVGLNLGIAPEAFVYDGNASPRVIGRDVSQATLSANGQVAAFDSSRGDEFSHVFAYEVATGATQRVSVSGNGAAGNENSRGPSLSGDGRFVAFQSDADNLVAGDTNSATDVFVHDRLTGTTERVSVASDGRQGDRTSWLPLRSTHAISDDGRFIVFESFATTLVPNDTNGEADIFVHDRLIGATERMSVAGDGTQVAPSTYGWPLTISANGLVVAFESDADSLVPGDDNDGRDLFVRAPRVDMDGGDPTGDGDIDDVVLQVFDMVSAELTDLGPADLVAVAGRSAAFLRPEAALDPSAQTVDSPEDLPQAIRGPSADGTISIATVAATGRVTDVNVVGLDIAHGYAGDLVIRLTSPFGTEVTLSSHNGFDGDGYLDTSFDDDAPRPIRGGVAPFSGAFHPEQRLSRFNGESPTGEWMLAVIDTAAFDDGALSAWQLEIEAEDAEDLNGDGDSNDRVVQLYSGGPMVENLGRAASALSMSEEWVAALISESMQTQDLNGDFDTRDEVVQLYNRPAGRWIDTRQPADTVQVAGSLVAFIMPEAARGPDGEDLNGDTDAVDRVLGLFDAVSETLIPVTDDAGRMQAAAEFVMGPPICLGGLSDGQDCATAGDCPGPGWCGPALVAFRTSEAAQGRNLIGSPASNVDVLQVYDLRARRLHSSGQAVTPCRFEACDPRLPYRVRKDTVTFLTLEPDQGGDLNNDGDQTDLVVQTFNARLADASAGLAASGTAAAPARTQRAQGAVFAAPVTALGSVGAGVCSDTGAPCLQDDDCAAGACFVPPGACTKDLGVSCDPPQDPQSPPPCGAGEFCGRVPGRNGVFHCMAALGPCRSNASCEDIAGCEQGGCRCANTGQRLLRLPSPLTSCPGGEQVFVTGESGRCILDFEGVCNDVVDLCPPQSSCLEPGVCRYLGDSCRSDFDCRFVQGATCQQELVIAGASDADGDEIADPFDNCPNVANVDQADATLDGVGDACQGAPPTPTGSTSPQATATSTPSRTITTTAPTDTPVASPTNTPLATPTATARSTRTDTALPTSTATRQTRPTETPPVPCVGDCSADGAVTVNEIILGVNVALGMESIAVCPVFDCNRNGELTVDCLIRAVSASLDGCS